MVRRAVLLCSAGLLLVASCTSAYGDAPGGAAVGDGDAGAVSRNSNKGDGGTTSTTPDGGGTTSTTPDGGGTTGFTQCVQPYVYCNDFEAADSLTTLKPFGTQDGAVTLEPATGPTAGQVAHFAIGTGGHDIAFDVPINATQVRLEALVRVTSPANAEDMMLFAMLGSDHASGAQVWLHNSLFTMSPYDGQPAPSIVASAGNVTSDWFLFVVEATHSGYGETVYSYLDPDAGGASVSFGTSSIVAPLDVVFGLFGEYGNALGDTAIDVDYIKVTAL